MALIRKCRSACANNISSINMRPLVAAFYAEFGVNILGDTILAFGPLSGRIACIPPAGRIRTQPFAVRNNRFRRADDIIGRAGSICSAAAAILTVRRAAWTGGKGNANKLLLWPQEDSCQQLRRFLREPVQDWDSIGFPGQTADYRLRFFILICRLAPHTYHLVFRKPWLPSRRLPAVRGCLPAPCA